MTATTVLASIAAAALTVGTLLAPIAAQENTKLPPAQMEAIQAMMAD
ncbi:MAG: hypothetical protein AAF366_17495 [Pseudomonadota bacterium]